MQVRYLYAAAVLGGFIIAITLWAWGQPLICTCGHVKFWEGNIWASGNSQHIADWYTLSHILHGVLIILMGRLFRGHISFPVLVAIAAVTGVAWEIVEHTDMVLDRFRGVTVYQGYIGDSVLNAVMDYVWMWVGFFVAHSLGTGWVVVLVIVLEVTAAIYGRDCLTFSTLQLVYPLDAINAYQQEINPNRAPVE